MSLQVSSSTLLTTALALITLSSCTSVPSTHEAPCEGEHYQSRSSQLKELYASDQKDRDDFLQWNEKRAAEVTRRDRERRSAVSVIFAEGCLKSAADYLYAATVFQHGEVPDHFFQTC